VSGRKQHHIPRLLLRGFGTPSGKTSKVWLFRRSQSPENPSIKNVGAERDFYSSPSADGFETLDDQITRYETGLSNMLAMLRGQRAGAGVDPTNAAEAVAHLTIRNAHLRDVFGLGVEELIAGAARVFADETNLRVLFGVEAEAPTPRMQELINETITNDPTLALTGLPDHLIRQIIFTLIKENFETFCARHVPIIKAGLDGIAQSARTAVRVGHNKALASNLKPKDRIEALRHLFWTVSAAPKGGVILPDCVALAIEDGSPDPVPYMMTANDRLNTVLLPICTEKVLIGRRCGTPVANLRSFNEAAAVCSHDFFIAAINTPELVGLTARIGERSQTVVLEAVSDVLREYRAELLESDPKTAPVGSQVTQRAMTGGSLFDQTNGEADHPHPLNYSIDFPDANDEEIAATVAFVVRLVISELSLVLPLCRLEGITFALDYTSALRNLERGFLVPAGLAPTNDDIGVGVAMAPLVVRDGDIKVRILIRGDLGLALIANDERARALAMHVLVYQLAHAACVELMERAIPGVSLRRIEDEYVAYIYGHMSAAWTGYFASRTSARFERSIGNSYRDMLLKALLRAHEGIPRARLAYRFDGNLDRFLQLAISTVGAVMRYGGNLLGHCDGLGESPYDNTSGLAAALERAGLREWFNIFHGDLRKVCERSDKWKSAEEFLALNRHFERVLWQFGVFPWKMSEGQTRVDIPLMTDVAQLREVFKNQLTGGPQNPR
jgi:Protein of unknown function (DUF4238)